MSLLRPNVLAAKARLAEGLEHLSQRHRAGHSGVTVCEELAALRDAVINDLYAAVLSDLSEDRAAGVGGRAALVAHGGYGRRDVAPQSDVDLMILHPRGLAGRVAPVAERLLRDVFDASLVLGHSVRTPEEAVRLAVADPSILTSLAESRLLAGDADLFERFVERLRREVRRRARTLLAAIERARLGERLRYGGTVFLLEPNLKRSRGGLRDLQLVRWAGFVRYGTTDPDELRRGQALSADDLEVVRQATEFLLRVRNELHFHAGHASDVLDRAEQVRIAGGFGYGDSPGMLPVERFMREYFRHTGAVSHLAGRFVARAKTRDRAAKLATMVLGHRVVGGMRAGPVGLMATRQGLAALKGDLTEIMRLVVLANLYDKPIAPATWEVIRREAARLPQGTPAEARRRFLALLAHPGRLGTLLRDLHDVGLLSRFIPEFEHARGLLQFNQYHKYTVDEHCLRAVEFATDLLDHQGPLGRVYRRIGPKRTLHLALLIHDLGKGRGGDHLDIGRRIAQEAAGRLELPPHEAEMLAFLVGSHFLMNHLAFRRDTGDERLVVRFAVEVGSPELLDMLYVLTAADLGAVGPGVWDTWKEDIVTDLYRRAARHLAADSSAVDVEQRLHERRRAAGARLGRRGKDPWFARQIEALPAAYLLAAAPEQIAADLEMLAAVEPGGATAQGQYSPETGTSQYVVGTREDVTPGIFHKLTGALTSRGLEILSAEINTLADGVVLDRFVVNDPDFAGEPPPERFAEVERALVASLGPSGEHPPAFRRIWGRARRLPAADDEPPTRIRTDNSTSERATVIDVFTRDRPGLLYAVSRALFELGLSVSRAKIATYADQVVDVFYVADQHGGKIEDDARLETIRRRLAEAIEAVEEG